MEEKYIEVVDLDKMSHAFKIKITCDDLKDGRDIATTEQINDLIKKNIEDKDELIVDMSNVNSISAKFAKFLIGLHKQLKGKADITIEGVKGNKRLADLFDVFRLNSLFVIESKPTHKYTKKQITEAIAYWEKQLIEGNYKRLNEEAGLENGKGAVIKIGAIGRWQVFDENGNFIKAAESIETLPALIGQLHVESGYDMFEFSEDIRNSERLNRLIYHDGTIIRGRKNVFNHIAHEIAKWMFDECGELPASTLSKIKVSEYGIVWKN